MGQKIGKEHGVIYVSTNQGRKWMELAEFATNVSGEEYLFLEHQLELFGDLCHVRVSYRGMETFLNFVIKCHIL